MGWFTRAARKEARGWNHTNAFNFAKPARSPRRNSALQEAWRKIRELRDEIKKLKNTLRHERKADKMNRPMKTDQVNPGSYEFYQAGLKRVMALTMKRQRLSTYTMPQIRAEIDGLLGLGKTTEFKGYGKRK